MTARFGGPPGPGSGVEPIIAGMDAERALLSADDHEAINQLLSLHGHLFDDGQLEELEELFTPNVEYDTSPMGGPVMHGIAEIVRVTRELGEKNPVAHVVANVVVTPIDADTASVRSKGIGITTDGGVGCVTYHDRVVRSADGWRLDRRTIRPRREPLTFS